MIKNILTAVMVLSLIAVLGCSEIEDFIQPSSPSGPDIVRRAQLGEQWQMDQTRVHVAVGDESLVLLRLDGGGRVDGYFYLEKGEDIEFKITGISLVYESEAIDTEDSARITSDRFSFVADQTQGTMYTLTFRNPTDDEQAKATVFLEVVYPVSGSLFFPISTK